MLFFEEIIIELSFNCNLSCIMCGFGKENNPFSSEKFIGIGSYKNILHQFGEITRTIRLNGRGESTIHPDFIEILSYTKSKYPQLNINLFSNFSFKKNKLLQKLIETQVQLFISIDSPIREELCTIRKGVNFDLIIKNLKLIQSIPNRPFIIFTLQEINIKRIYDIALFAKKHNCQLIFNTIRKDFGIDDFKNVIIKNYDYIIEQFKKASMLYLNSKLQCLFPDQICGIELNLNTSTTTHGSIQECPALNKELCILYDGTVTPCNMFNPYEYGNIFNTELSDIWRGDKREAFLTYHKKHYYCKNCSNLGV